MELGRVEPKGIINEPTRLDAPPRLVGAARPSGNRLSRRQSKAREFFPDQVNQRLHSSGL